MNGQFKYIFVAFLFLLLSMGVYLFITNLTFSPEEQINESGYLADTPGRDIQYSPKAAQGKAIFMSSCASCHQLFKDATGPGLFGFEERGPWGIELTCING